jgi:hypothetical protein
MKRPYRTRCARRLIPALVPDFYETSRWEERHSTENNANGYFLSKFAFISSSVGVLLGTPSFGTSTFAIHAIALSTMPR